MKLIAIVFSILISISADAFAADNARSAELDNEIARFLTALEFGQDAKVTYAEAASRGDIDAKTAKAIAMISEKRFAELAVPAIRSLVSLEEAKEMANFYSSAEMRAMLAEQKRSGRDAPVATDRKQAEAVLAFMRSKAGQAAVRLQKAMLEPEFLAALGSAIDQELLKY